MCELSNPPLLSRSDIGGHDAQEGSSTPSFIGARGLRSGFSKGSEVAATEATTAFFLQ